MSFRPYYQSHHGRGAGRGFTLVEILTATAIMALLVSLVMTILSQVVSAWNRSSDELAIGAQARSALDVLTQDLQTAIFRSDGTQWLSSTTEETPDSPVSGVTTSRLIFFTTAVLHQTKDDSTAGKAGNAIYGDLCAVEYRVTYGDPFGNPTSQLKTFSLHRVAIDPASTFNGINGKPVMGIYANDTRTPPGKKTLEDNFDSLVDGSHSGVTSTLTGTQGRSLRVTLYGALSKDSILLDNVARFNVFLFYYGSNAVSGANPATQLYPQTFPPVPPGTKFYFGGWQRGSSGAPTNAGEVGFLDLISGSSKPTFIRLAFADITMTVLTDDGVALLNTFQGSMPQSLTWEDFLDQYGKTYTQRVRFYNSP